MTNYSDDLAGNIGICSTCGEPVTFEDTYYRMLPLLLWHARCLPLADKTNAIRGDEHGQEDQVGQGVAPMSDADSERQSQGEHDQE